MFPPWAPIIRQRLAHGAVTTANAFASPPPFAQDGHKALAYAADGLFCDDCYPSPYPWPGPVRVRPFFVWGKWRRVADIVPLCSFGFYLAPNAVESGSIKTITRGSVTCVNRPFLSWRFVRPHFRRALTTIFNAAASVPLAAQLLLTRLVPIRSPGQLLAASAAWFATILTFADRPNFVGQACPTPFERTKTTRAKSPVWFFYVRSADGTSEGRQCSKRS
jgi:hypothetical protein